MRQGILIIILFLTAATFKIHCQEDDERPEAPVLKLVTVDPENNDTGIRWNLSPSTDVAGYVIYSYIDGEGFALDTLYDPGVTYYSRHGSGPAYFSESFVVAAIDFAGNVSPLSNELYTIHAIATIDSCNKKLEISWNKYSSDPLEVIGYSVEVSEDGSSFVTAGETNPDETSIELTSFSTDAEYCFVVKALLDEDETTSSNKTCLLTRMQQPPVWINADYATIGEEAGISLSFTIDPSSEITSFVLERKTAPDITFREISRFETSGGSVRYTDNQADINIINYYRLLAINNCGVPVTVSNIASNIRLSLERDGDVLDLQWNACRSWLGTISSCNLYADTGNGFTILQGIEPQDTLLSIYYHDIMYNVSDDRVCFYIVASESSNPYGINGESRSNTVCLPVIENITVPNIFTPDGDLKNDLFKPVLSFTPESYYLIISDRQGKVLFETKDHSESWDGTRNGDPLPQGVYLWLMEVNTPSGKSISRTGTITIYKNQD